MPKSDHIALSELLHNSQRTIIDRANQLFGPGTVTPEIERAFIETPRHNFAPRYLDGRKGSWTELSSSALESQIPALYADRPLCILQDDKGHVVSTISQPSLVLGMLSLLELKPGQTVFELGGGSGWNAAMIGRLVGENGRVYSVEIEPALAASAKNAVEQLGLTNVEIICGDGGLGWPAAAPYDRGVFTASARSLPAPFFSQIKDGGLLLAVIELYEGVDLLAVLRKNGAAFQSEMHFPCSFVPVTGETAIQKADTRKARRRDWIKLDIAKPDQTAFSDFLRVIGEPADDHALRSIFELWIAANKPDYEDLDLAIYPADSAPNPKPRQWIVHRSTCKLVWSIR